MNLVERKRAAGAFVHTGIHGCCSCNNYIRGGGRHRRPFSLALLAYLSNVATLYKPSQMSAAVAALDGTDAGNY